MRRSEMINKISNIVHEWRRATDAYSSDEIAEMILATQEFEGMLPPLGLDKTQIYPPGNKFHNPDYVGSLEHVWEPEDTDDDNYCGAV